MIHTSTHKHSRAQPTGSWAMLREPWTGLVDPGGRPSTLSAFRSFYPFENRRRFTMNPNTSVKIFNTAPAVSRPGLSLASPIPYLIGPSVPTYPIGSLENIIAANYNPTFGVLSLNNNNPGRIIQVALKIYW